MNTNHRILALALAAAFAGTAHGAPQGGAVTAGTATISSAGATTTITQTSARVAVNWQSFGVAAGEAVRFVQPGTGSVALNRVVGGDPSAILGSLSSNGKVFLVNPNGILFGSGASVNVGSLVASTLSLSDAAFMAGRDAFSGAGGGKVVNHGTINADGGYVVLMGREVSNLGTISARMGMVALAAGTGITLDVAGDNLLNVVVDQGAMGALVNNGGLIQADGGHVLLTAQAAAGLVSTVVNNTGVIQARTLSSRNGVIRLMGDMQAGFVDVGGTLDASAPAAGDGGFIETSAARVVVQPSARVTTASASGRTGTWLIDPEDFRIGSAAGDNISGATLSALLVTNSVTITTATGTDATAAGAPPTRSLFTATPGAGDIFVNDAVTWTAAPNTTTLTLNAARDVILNRPVVATNGNFVVCCGRDITMGAAAAITTTNGSVLLSAGRTLAMSAALTTTDGNITMCSAGDINIAGAITLTRAAAVPSQSLGLAAGLVLNAGTGGTGPGAIGGTVRFAPLTPPAAVTVAPVTITYNPTSYTTPTDYAVNFTLTGGAALAQKMLVFPVANKTFDGTTAVTLAGLQGAPAGVTLLGGPGSTASFLTPDVGVDKPFTFSGFTLGGANASAFALPLTCCAPIVSTARGAISAALVVPPPPVPPAPPVPVPAPVVIPGPVPVPVPVPVVVPVPVPVPVPVTVVPVAAPVPGVVPAPVSSPPVVAATNEDYVVPAFTSVAVAPVLLRAPALVTLVEAPVPMQLMSLQQEVPVAPTPVRVTTPAAAPAPAAVPAPAPQTLPARPFRN